MERKTYIIDCKNIGKTQIETSYSKLLIINKKNIFISYYYRGN